MSVGAFGAKEKKGRMTQDKLVLEEKNVVSQYLLTPTPKLFYPTAGDTVGYTYWDYWHNNGQRRQIAKDGLGNLHFNWRNAIDAELLERYIYYNSVDTGGGWLAAGTGIQVNSGGYTGLDVFPDGREALAYHNINTWYCILSVEETTPGLGEFSHYDLPDSIPGGKSAGTTWPSMAISKASSGDTAFVHVVSTDAGGGGAGYVRCFLDPNGGDTTLACQSPGFALVKAYANKKMTPKGQIYQWDPKRGNADGVFTATSPVSRKVAVADIKQYNSGDYLADGEVVYYESTNNGTDWITNGNLGTMTKVTNYGTDGWKTYKTNQDEMTMVYDYNNNLHLVWYTNTPGDVFDNILWHWSSGSGVISKITTAHVATANPGAFSRAITKMTLGVTSAAPNYLYVTYTKYKDSDKSAAGFANGDIYIQGSSNGGLTWGPVVNLTNTPDSGCAAGNCRSENYASIAEKVDDSINVFYLYDLDAGPFAYSTAEGQATNSPARYLTQPRPLVPAVPSIAFAPSAMTSPIRWALNHSSVSESLMVDNTGTATLQVQLSGPSWLTATPSSFSIIEAGPTQKVNLTLNGGPYADTFLTGKLMVVSNSGVVGGGAVWKDTQYVDIDFVVTDTFYYAEFDTCKRGPVLVVSNVGNIGGASDSAGMFYKGLNYLFDGTPLMSTNQVPGFGSDTVGFSWIHAEKDFVPEGHLIKTDYPSLKATVWIDKFALLNWRKPSTNPTHWAWFGWTKWSKIIQFDWVPGKIHAVLIKNWWTWNKPPKWWMDVSSTGPAGGYFGIGGDWDVTGAYSGKDKGGIIDSLNLVYLVQDTIASNKYYGGYQFLSAYVKKGATTTNYTIPFAMRVELNRTQLFQPGLDGYGDDSLYKSMSTPGDNIEGDSALDRNIVISAVEMLNPDTTTEIGIDYTAIVSDSGLTDFVRQAATLKKVKPGDANVDGKVTVSDVVYLVNYLFKGGPEPWLLFSDANGDAKVTVSDVVYLVNYLFKGGPPAKFVVGDKPF
jgi:hypothetical protein